MAASIRSDLIRDSGAEKTRDGIRIRRSFWVTGLDTSSPSTIPSQALTAVLSTVPYGSAHPDTNYSVCLATSYQVNPVGSDSMAEVVVTYELKTADGQQSSGEVLVEYDGGLTTELTTTDKDGNPLTVNWYPDANNRNVFKFQTAQVPVLRPSGQLRVTRFVTLADSSDPTIDNLIANFEGRVNSAVWRGKPKWAWLCSNIHVVQFSVRQYKVIGTFDWKPWVTSGGISNTRGNWVADCAFLLAENGGHPPGNFVKDDNAATANGYLLGEVYPEADFNSSGFS